MSIFTVEADLIKCLTKTDNDIKMNKYLYVYKTHRDRSRHNLYFSSSA